jgi:hypothetical protein
MDLPKQAAERDLRIAMIEKLILATLADRNAGLEKSIAQWRLVGLGQVAAAQTRE